MHKGISVEETFSFITMQYSEPSLKSQIFSSVAFTRKAVALMERVVFQRLLLPSDGLSVTHIKHESSLTPPTFLNSTIIRPSVTGELSLFKYVEAAALCGKVNKHPQKIAIADKSDKMFFRIITCSFQFKLDKFFLWY